MVGMVVGFLLIHLMLIRGRRHVSAGQVYRYILVNVFGATLASSPSSLLARQVFPHFSWIAFPFEIAHLAGVAAPAGASYFLHRHCTFLEPERTQKRV